MEAANLNGIVPAGMEAKPLSISRAVIGAVCNAISNATGKKFTDQSALLPVHTEQEAADPSQLAMAVAYANLCMEEPEMVTSQHKKMLRSAFSYEQIQDLNGLIKRMME